MTSQNPTTGSHERRLAKITAVIRLDLIEGVEERLHELQVPGVSVSKVKGFGEYLDFFARGWQTDHARLEIFLDWSRAEEVARAIMAAARTGGAGDGILVVQEVEAIYRIRTGQPMFEGPDGAAG